MDSFVTETIEDILQDCMGPGEDYGYHIYIKTYDDDVVEERMQSHNVDDEDDEDDDEDEEDEEDKEGPEECEITRILDDSTWKESGFVKGYVMEVTGEKAAVYREDNGKDKLIIPNLLQLLHKLKSAVPNKWYEHKPGWKYRLLLEKVADTV